VTLLRVGKVVFGVIGTEEVLWGFEGDGDRHGSDNGESNGSVCGQYEMRRSHKRVEGKGVPV
jgi:hypothetical protein